MMHLTEEELVERYYGEDSPETARHLDSCRECKAAYAALETDLHEIPSIEPPPRDERYEDDVWRALSPALTPWSHSGESRLRIHLWQVLAATAACAVLVAAAFYAGRIWEHRQPQAAVVKMPAPPPQHVVVVVLSDHLDRTERLLVELKHADANDAEMFPPLRDEARSLLADNRRFQESAENTGDPALSAALDRLDQLLTQLASRPGGLNAAALATLQHQIDTDGLLFEVRVLRSRVPDQHAKQNSHLKGGTA
jgi:hypothetical protein